MAPKRPLESEGAATAAGPAARKHRKGFRVGPENLPDGPWRRKVDKIKRGLIEKAKVKKAYKKIKAAQQTAPPASSSKPDTEETAENGIKAEAGDNDDAKEEEAPPSPQIHPERQVMLDEPEVHEPPPPPPRPPLPPTDRPPRERGGPRHKKNDRKPGYFDKAVADADRKRAEAEARAAEHARREAERRSKTEERERFRRAMAKARRPGRDGQRKLGRESGVLLERVRRMAGEGR